jgi:Tfp pilus assembly protein FimV
VLIVISTVVVALVLLLASSVVATSDVADVDSYVIAEYEVRAGDNLWDIAGQHTSVDRDVRNTIEAIKRLNRLDNSTIHPGQVLEIPLAGSS